MSPSGQQFLEEDYGEVVSGKYAGLEGLGSGTKAEYGGGESA